MTTVPDTLTEAGFGTLEMDSAGTRRKLVNEHVRTAPARTFAAGMVNALLEIGAAKLAGFPDTALFESVQLALDDEIVQPAGPVSVIVAAWFVTPRMEEGPVTATPAVAVVTE